MITYFISVTYLFNVFVLDINSDLEIPSRRTLGRRIDDDYNCTVEYLKQTFQSINCISTTADIWSTKQKFYRRHCALGKKINKKINNLF